MTVGIRESVLLSNRRVTRTYDRNNASTRLDLLENLLLQMDKSEPTKSYIEIDSTPREHRRRKGETHEKECALTPKAARRAVSSLYK